MILSRLIYSSFREIRLPFSSFPGQSGEEARHFSDREQSDSLGALQRPFCSADRGHPVHIAVFDLMIQRGENV